MLRILSTTFSYLVVQRALSTAILVLYPWGYGDYYDGLARNPLRWLNVGRCMVTRM